jgi:CBS domain-containing protein
VLVGIIAYSDVLSALSSRLSKSAPEENAILHQLPARRIMRDNFVAVRPTEPLERVAELLWETRGGCVPVTEDDGTLVGIITEGDFVRLTHHFLLAV